MNVAGFYCAIGGKVTVIEQQDHTKPVTVKIWIGYCQSAKTYERQMELLKAMNAGSCVISGDLEAYLTRYKHSKATRLF